MNFDQILSTTVALCTYLEWARGSWWHQSNNHWWGVDECGSCHFDALMLESKSIVYDLAVAQQHRVTGGPHPRLLGLTDGAALASAAGVAWS